MKNFVSRRDKSQIPRRDRQASPKKGHEPTRAKKETLIVINRDFAYGGETSGAREVYASQISGTSLAGNCPREDGEVVISCSETEMEHVTCSHEDALGITAEIDGYDVKRVLINLGSSTHVLFLDAVKNMGRSKKDLKKVNFPLMGFASNATYPVGAITLPVYIGE